MPDTLRFMEENHRWMATEAEKNWDTSDYWLAVKGVVAQLDGLLAGVQAGCPGYQPVGVENRTAGASQYYRGVYLPSMTRGPSLIHLLLLNGNGDLYQVSCLPFLAI